jgi:hypothetical protein
VWANVSAPASTLDPAVVPVAGAPTSTVPPASPRRGTGIVAWVLLIGLFPLARLAVFLAKPAALQQREFMDDFYYYALIARSLADGDGSTFTGIVETNGYQPLWQFLLVPPAWLADGDAFLRLTYVLETALFGLTVAMAYLIARRVRASLAGAYAAAYAVGIGTCAGNLFFQGMEIVVLLPVLLAVVHRVLVLSDPGRPSRPVRDGLVLGGLMFLLVMARLDTLAFVGALGLGLLLNRSWGRARLGTLLVAGGTVAGGLLAYAGANAAVFGTPVPVSGLAKALGGGGLRADLLEQFLSFGAVGSLRGLLGTQAVLAVAIALVLLRRAAVRRQPVFGEADGPVATVLAALLLGQAVMLGYYTVSSSWPFWGWYFYYIPVMLFLGLLVVARVVLTTRVGAVARRPGPAAAAGLTAVALTVGASWGPPPADFWDGGVPAAAAWIQGHTGPTDVVAVGDRAGYLSWLTRRPTLQLEGLVQDVDYLDVLADGQIQAYLDAHHVRFYVRGDNLPAAPASALPGRPGCSGYVEPVMGGGPKSTVVACDSDLVYSVPGPGFQWRIWRYGDVVRREPVHRGAEPGRNALTA